MDKTSDREVIQCFSFIFCDNMVSQPIYDINFNLIQNSVDNCFSLIIHLPCHEAIVVCWNSATKCF